MRTPTRWAALASLLALAAALAPFPAPPRAAAESWCAYPLWVHEWGVQVFGADGAPRTPVPLPRYFHGTGPAGAPTAGRVPARHLPPDSGVRALPVLHFYSAGSLSAPIPVGVEVGFARGDASRWYPQVDRLVPGSAARSAAALAAREALLRDRVGPPFSFTGRTLPPDPTRQLGWDRLELVRSPRHAPVQSPVPWVDALRGLDALWVDGADESERFVFYEADTRERPALALSVGGEWAPGRRHLLLHNRSAYPAHDVFFVHREGEALHVFFAPCIPAGASAGFLLEDHRVTAGGERAATRDLLRAQLVDPTGPAPPARPGFAGADCVMQRDPAVPVERASGHRLYAAEVDAILDVWAPHLFEAPGTTLLYREDAASLDEAMPLSLYTDMYNHIELRRLGLAVTRGVTLPTP